MSNEWQERKLKWNNGYIWEMFQITFVVAEQALPD